MTPQSFLLSKISNTAVRPRASLHVNVFLCHVVNNVVDTERDVLFLVVSEHRDVLIPSVLHLLPLPFESGICLQPNSNLFIVLQLFYESMDGPLDGLIIKIPADELFSLRLDTNFIPNILEI